jgi:hypothetical protein
MPIRSWLRNVQIPASAKIRRGNAKVMTSILSEREGASASRRAVPAHTYAPDLQRKQQECDADQWRKALECKRGMQWIGSPEYGVNWKIIDRRQRHDESKK